MMERGEIEETWRGEIVSYNAHLTAEEERQVR